ncbi:MAG: hypothetical protein JWL91_2659 [Sphingomonas bacterium]|nr:hypothetical protein [Sphingomonas bacterium]
MTGYGSEQSRRARPFRRGAWQGGALLALALAAGSSAQAAPVRTDSVRAARGTAGCGEDCLTAVLDRFLGAMAAHDATAVPLAAAARYTENGIELPFSAGLWRTFSGPGSYRHVFADEKAGQIAMFADIKENGVSQLLMLRLKVESGKVSEAEALVQRRQSTRFINTEGLTLDPLWGEKLAGGDRRTRQQLITAVDPYFDGLASGDGDSVPFADDCFRLENGITTAGVDGKHQRMGAIPTGGEQRPLQRCRDQFNGGGTVYIQSVSPRRYLIVDETRGLVFGMFHFDQPGDILQAKGKDGTTRPMPEAAIRPFTTPVAELFKVKNGKIVAIEAIMTVVPYGSKAGW